MTTRTVLSHYQEALETIVGLEVQISLSCYTVRLGALGDVWGVTLAGAKSPHLSRLIRHFGASHDATRDLRDGHNIVREFSAYRGRTRVTIQEVEHVIRRVDGRTGQLMAVRGPR